MAVDVEDSGHISSEDDLSPNETQAEQLLSPLSKKAKARRRKALKKASNSNLASTAASISDLLQQDSSKEPLQSTSSSPNVNGSPKDGSSAASTVSDLAEGALGQDRAKQASQQNVDAALQNADRTPTSTSTPKMNGISHAISPEKPSLSALLNVQQQHNVFDSSISASSISEFGADDSDTTEDEDLLPDIVDQEDDPTQRIDVLQDSQVIPNTSPSQSPRMDSVPSTPRKATRQTVQAVQAFTGADHQSSSRLQSILTRTIWTLIMIGSFIGALDRIFLIFSSPLKNESAGLILAGHGYVIALVFTVQAQVFRELVSLFDVGSKHSSSDRPHSAAYISAKERKRLERARYSKTLSWYFFATSNYFFYGESIIYYFKHIVLVDAYFLPFAKHHRFISFSLWTLGFVWFVTTLKRDTLRRQFGLFCWIHMSLLLIVVSA